MAVLVVDARSRSTIPIEFKLTDSKATLISAGLSLIVATIPRQPLEASGSWLDSTSSGKELKDMAEKGEWKETDLMTEADVLYAVSDYTIAPAGEVFDKVKRIKRVDLRSL
jgi:hypothetical protein